MHPIRRRETFTWLGAVFALRAAQDPPSLGFAIGTYGMKPLPTVQALRTIAATGYDGVELALMPGWPADPANLTAADRKEIAKTLEDTGLILPALNENLPLTATPQSRAHNLERLKLAAEMAHQLSPAKPPCLDTILGLKTADWESSKNRIVDELHDWVRLAESAAFTIGVKPHAAQALDTPAKSIWLMNQLRSPRLRLIYDYSHMFVGGFGLEPSLREMLPYTVFISLKDSRGKPWNPEFLLAGDGETDYAAYFRLLGKLGYNGFVSIEVSSMIQRKPGYDPIAAARLCYGRLAPVFGKAGIKRRRT
jgi:inosose dehydratase